MNTQPNARLHHTVQRWMADQLLDVVRAYDDWHHVITDIPMGLGSSSLEKLSGIQEFQLSDIRRISLGQTQVQVTVDAKVGISIRVDFSDYTQSREVRDLVGEADEEFLGCYFDLESPVTLTLKLTLLNEPPMVTDHFLTQIDGGVTTVTFKEW